VRLGVVFLGDDVVHPRLVDDDDCLSVRPGPDVLAALRLRNGFAVARDHDFDGILCV
jgi:hypothetical protein